MLMQETNEEMMKICKEIYNQYKDKIKPNKKSGESIIKYILDNYPTIDVEASQLEDMILQDMMSNDFFKDKLGNRKPNIKIFVIKDEEKGHDLYIKQNEECEGNLIFIAIEMQTSAIFVKDSRDLYEELVAFTGLDKEDIKNEFLVAQYIQCKKKFKI